jgi:hypothetical protein
LLLMPRMRAYLLILYAQAPLRVDSSGVKDYAEPSQRAATITRVSAVSCCRAHAMFRLPTVPSRRTRYVIITPAYRRHMPPMSMLYARRH